MTTYRIKIVPKVTPNADGEWRTVDVAPLPDAASWIDMILQIDDDVPDTHFIVAVERAS